MKQANISIRKVSDLTLWDKNPRSITDKDFERLKQQIQKLGMYKPLLVNQDGIVLGGNMRLRALKDMGVEEVAVSEVSTSSEDEMIEYALSDNDRAGEYDQQQLAELVADSGIDMGLFRVDLGRTWEIKDVLSKFTGDDDVPEPETDPENIKSVLGEIYQLGDHRLMCGDSTSFDDVDKLMNGLKARMIFTDPPYMVNYQSPSGGNYDGSKYKHHDGQIINDNLSDEDAVKFYQDVATNLYAHSTDDACVYWWYASAKQHLNFKALVESGWHVSQIVIWVKNGIVMSHGQLFHRAYEPCMVGWKAGNSSYKNKLVVNLKDVWSLDVQDYAELADVWYQKRDSISEYQHPTQKPIGLAVRALKRSSQIGDLVLDLFGGSGSTLIACDENQRTCYTMELDPAYVDVIRKRYAISKGHADDWEDYTKTTGNGGSTE